MSGAPRPRVRAVVTGALTAVVAALALSAAPAPAQLLAPASPTDRSPYLDWPALLPPLPSAARQPTERDCIEGAATCIDRTIAEMTYRLNAGVPACDHRAVFALAYLRVTEDVRDALGAGAFADPRWLSNEDRVFARMYFTAYDDYAAGRPAAVPVAWQMAFDAARTKAVSGLGNFLMSMNAHINRDFPYLLDGIGIRTADGTSRKPDHDRYNRRLAALFEPVLAEVAARFDPTADDADADAGPVDNEAAFAILQSWREVVWRNAERLTNARTQARRRDVAASIEAYATEVARFLRGTFRDRGSPPGAARDAWCALHGGQDPTYGASALRPGAAVLLSGRRVRLARDGTLRLRLRCPAATSGCTGRIRLLRAGARIGGGAYGVRAGERKGVAVALSHPARRSLRRHGRLARVRLVLMREGFPGPPRRALTILRQRRG
jgi:hypothetical protein